MTHDVLIKMQIILEIHVILIFVLYSKKIK